MPTPNAEYIHKIYSAVKDAYAKTGFDLSEQEFQTRLSADSAYGTKIYTAVKDAYGSSGFNLSPQEFHNKIGINYTEKTPQQASINADQTSQEQTFHNLAVQPEQRTQANFEASQLHQQSTQPQDIGQQFLNKNYGNNTRNVTRRTSNTC